MTSRDFCFWLQGYFEISHAPGPVGGLDAKQVILVKQHLALVFKHEIDPSMGPPEHQAKLNEVHASGATDEPSTPARPTPQIGGGHSPFGPVMRC